MTLRKKPPDDSPQPWRPNHPEGPPKLPEVTSPLLNPPETVIIPGALNLGIVPNLIPPSGTTQQQAKVLRELLLEKAKRDIEALKLYEPIALAQEFHGSKSKFRLLRGSNRAGKTLAACAEVARAVTGRDDKYPKKNGRFFIVGKDGKHLGQVIYRKLFRAGAFRIIRDALPPHKWRVFRPTDPLDIAREKEAKLAPPLIPPRFIAHDGISWEDKRQSIPNLIRLTTGWEISFFPSGAKPPQGSDIDGCLAPWSEVYDPVLGCKRRVDTIDGPWHVLTFNEEMGAVEIGRARKPFVKEYGEIIRLGLSDGRAIYATTKHRVLAASGEWVSAQDAYRERIAIRSVSRLDGDENLDGRNLAEQMRERFQKALRSERLLDCGINQEVVCQSNDGHVSRLSALDCENVYVRHESQKGEDCQGDYCLSTHLHDEPFPAQLDAVQASLPLQERVAGHSLSHWRADGQEHRAIRTPQRLCEAFCETASFEDQPFASLPSPLSRSEGLLAPRRQDAWQPQRSSYSQKHKGGEPLHDRDGFCENRPTFVLECQPLLASDEGTSTTSESVSSSTPGCADQSRKAGKESLFQATCETDCGADDSISPCNYITSLEVICQGEIWDFTVEETHNYIYGGTVSHNCLFDEEIIDPDWLPEMTARLVDRNGKFIWSATPQAGTEQLYSLHEEAESQADEKSPRHKEFVLLLSDNPYLTDDQKKEFEESLQSDEERRVRVGGEFARLSFRVYPEFNLERIHGVDFFEIPQTWTRFVAIDPGRQVCAAIFAAVPPPMKGDFIYFYDELYIRNCNADLFGQHMAKKAQEQSFYCFLIDHQAARVTEMASGITIEFQYAEALKRHKVKSHMTGNGFIWGATDVQSGIEAFRSWLIIRPNDQGPKLRVLRDRMPNFKKEVERYPYKRDKNGITDKPEDRGPVHLMACARYLALHRPQFRDYRPERIRRNPAALALEAKQRKRKRASEGDSYIRLGPTSDYSGVGR